MDPQVKSVISSVALAIATSAATWAVAKGLIPAADKASFANDLVTLALGVGSAAIAWWKARQVSPTQLIKEVNKGDNGVKVVAEDEPVPPVNRPLK